MLSSKASRYVVGKRSVAAIIQPCETARFSETWAAAFNSEVWGTGPSGMYDEPTQSGRPQQETGGLPALKPTEKENTD
jgi:hypothetical protein